MSLEINTSVVSEVTGNRNPLKQPETQQGPSPLTLPETQQGPLIRPEINPTTGIPPLTRKPFPEDPEQQRRNEEVKKKIGPQEEDNGEENNESSAWYHSIPKTK